MGRGTKIVVLALLALALAPAVAAAAPACPTGNLADISVYVPRAVHVGADLTVELEGEAVFVDAYSNVVLTVGGVRTPVALEGYGTTVVTVKAPARPGRVPVTVTWDQVAGADGADSNGPQTGACSGSVTEELLAARWSGASGDLVLPRLQGKWRFVMTAPDGAPSRFAWRLQPSCGIGACEVTVDVGKPWNRVRLRLAGRAYRGSEVMRVRGVACAVNGRNVYGPADAHLGITLWVAGARVVDGQLVATRLTGQVVTWSDNGGGAISSCRPPGRLKFQLRAVPG